MQKRMQQNFYPYLSHEQYCLAKALSTPRLATNTMIRAIAIDGSNSFLKKGIGFSSIKDFLSGIDEMTSCQTPWENVEIVNKDGDESWGPRLTYYKRNTAAVLEEILGNESLIDKCVYAPIKEYGSNHERVYTDMHVCDWWWETQVSLPSYTNSNKRQKYQQTFLSIV
jgi:Plavaka transposase